ncbi:MAG: hypothetical protein WCO44_02410 [Bacteroidota bacterium]
MIFFSPLRCILIIMMVMPGLMMISCKKKSSESSGSTPSERIIEWAYYANDTINSKTVFQYSGNQLSSAIDYHSSHLVKTAKTTFQYSGNQLISVTRYDTANGIWYKSSFTEVTSFSGTNPVEILTHSFDQAGNEYTAYKWIYTFGTAGLTSATWYNFSLGSWTESEKALCTYDSNKRIIATDITYNNGNEKYWITYLYQGNQITTELDSTKYSGSLDIWKYAMEYTGGRLTSSKGYDWNNNTWVQYNIENYTYNSLGNILIYQDQELNSQHKYREEFKYEAGSGNYRQYEAITGNYSPLVTGWPWPAPVKSTDGGRSTVKGDPLPFPVKALPGHGH